MMITLSNRCVTLLAVAFAAAPAASAAPASPAAPVAPAAPAASPRAWLTGNTSGRGLRWTHGGSIMRSVGKVFFTLDKIDYVLRDNMRVLYSAVLGPDARSVYRQASVSPGR